MRLPYATQTAHRAVDNRMYNNLHVCNNFNTRVQEFVAVFFPTAMSVTIKDVAHRAGVSHPTVSRALRNDPLVTPDTITRIKQIASELGYVPSAAARSLKTSRSRVIGVLVNRTSDPFYSQVLDGIQDQLHGAGYAMFLGSANRDAAREQDLVQAMAERRVDGLIVCSMFVTRAARQQLNVHGAPVVVVHNRARDRIPHSIYHDDRYGARVLTHHLLELGHRRIAFLGNARGGRETRERLAGIRAALRAADLTLPKHYIVHAPNGQLASGEIAARPFLDLKRPPTALIAFNDMLAIGALKTFRAAGKKIPQDVSIVGFDDVTFAEYVAPPLTTFHQPKYRLGQEAARMMLRLLDENSDGKPAREVVTLRGELLVRASTARVKA